MNDYEIYSMLIDKIYENKKDEFKKEVKFCCGTLGTYQVFVNDIIELVKSDENKLCEVTRLKSDNPVIYRDSDGKIFRCHGESCYLKKEMIRLVCLSENEFNLNPSFKYD